MAMSINSQTVGNRKRCAKSPGSLLEIKLPNSSILGCESLTSHARRFVLIFSIICCTYPIMVTVAVAGGTGRVGRVIVDALRKSEEHEVVVLTRKV